jgi:putative acetyltransferase
MTGIVIREELARDCVEIRRVNEAAFGRADEANLIEKLREPGDVLLSLVAEVDGEIVGHILFSRMTVETERGSIAAVALAPMAVTPGHQRKGVGSALVRRGLEVLRERGERVVLVLGHEHYYPRFGFSVEKARDLSSPFPREAYMAMELAEGELEGVRGTVRYSRAVGL